VRGAPETGGASSRPIGAISCPAKGEPARAALKLVDQHLGKLPVKAVIYSHSHGDLRRFGLKEDF